MAEYAYLVVYLPRGMTRDAARRVLTDHAEYGEWELSRLRLYADGSRKVTLRRKISTRRPHPLTWAYLPGGSTAIPARPGWAG